MMTKICILPVASLQYLRKQFPATNAFKASANQSMSSKRMTMTRRLMWLTSSAPMVTCDPGDILQNVLEKYIGDGSRYEYILILASFISHYLLRNLGHCEKLSNGFTYVTISDIPFRCNLVISNRDGNIINCPPARPLFLFSTKTMGENARYVSKNYRQL